MTHSITAIHFGPSLDQSPVQCACGWSGTVAEVRALKHRPLRVQAASREADPAMPWMRLPDTRVISAVLP